MTLIRLLHKSITSVTERVSESAWLDPIGEFLHAKVSPVFGPDGDPTIKDALYGTWLGHPLHPVMTDLPIGFWTSSFVLDLTGQQKAADLTLKLGTLSALGAAATGYAQWYDLQNMEAPRRVGTLHAVVNVTATGCYALSWYFRSNQQRSAGLVASTMGMSLASFGGLLGGELSFRLGIGVNRNAFEDAPDSWTSIVALDDLPPGTLVRVDRPDNPLLVLRQGDDVLVTSATCTHVGAPLDEGELDEACVTCPWHGSVFDLRQGDVVHGPATAPLTSYEVRLREGQVEIRA